MQIDVLRPLSARKVGGATTVPSGGGNTVASVTADNNDATYVNFPLANSGNNWSARMEPHTPPTNYQRHQIRGRARILTDAGTAVETIDLGRGTSDALASGQVTATSVVTEVFGSWSAATAFSLAGATTISDFNMGGGYPASAAGSMTALRTTEIYLDVDCRLRAQYSPEIRDAAGVNQNNATIIDTDKPIFWFGTPAYDNLPPERWSVTVTAQDGTNMWDGFGPGSPPESIVSGVSLPDGLYTITFNASSTIRGADEFPSIRVFTVTIHNVVPPPSPPLLTVEREGEGYRLTWENPGGQTWDDDYVITEVWRDDCTGSQRIATVTDGLNGSYLDLAIPQLDENGLCGNDPIACDITYRVRYWGYVSTTVTLPTVVPVALVIGWPASSGSIPSGWLRVTDLDGFHPRGATGTGTPTATGGASSHTHTTPSHVHTFPSHTHTMPSNSETSNVSTTTSRASAGRPLASQPHSHLMPGLGASDTSLSGSTSAGSTSAGNDPASREVIWIRSDGSATQYPVGALAFSAQSVSGWTADTLSSGRYLKGAAAAGNGGAQIGAMTHTHGVLSHTHTGGDHDHPNFTTGRSQPDLTTTFGLPGAGPASPEWYGWHTHAANPLSSGAGTLPAATGGTSSVSSIEPPHRRLRVLRNTNGGLQTRIIGLYTGPGTSVPAGLTICQGANGTPDMRGLFARDAGTASVNTTGGATSHTHTLPTHVHPNTSHSHQVSLAASTNASYRRGAAGDLISVPTENHTHPNTTSGATTLSNSPAGNGTTGSASNLPNYREVHFVRLDGTIDGGTLPTPSQRVTDFASATVPAVAFGQEYDRFSTLSGLTLAVATDRGHSYPRFAVESVPLEGGTHSASTSGPGEDLSVSFPVVGKDQIDAAEVLLAADRVYWAPLGGAPGWFAPGGWSVEPAAPDVKVISLTLVRQPWPSVEDPANLL